MNKNTENQIDELLSWIISNITYTIDDISFCIKHEPDQLVKVKIDELDDLIQKYHRLHAFSALAFRG